MILKINRRRWLNGGNKNLVYSKLLSPHNDRQCCLGFLAREVGYSKEEINDLGCPSDAARETGDNKFPKGFLRWRRNTLSEPWIDTKVCRKMMDVNDDKEITNKLREEKLTKLFAKVGIKVEFFG